MRYMPRAKPRQLVSTAPPERLPEQVVEEQLPLEARLSVLNRAQLQALVQALAARQPNLAELILTSDLAPAERQTWAERLAAWQSEAAEYGIDTAFEAAQVAAVQGWDDPELQRMLRGGAASSESETAWTESDLVTVRLNVL